MNSPILNNDIDYQAADNEWRRHALLDHKSFNLHPNLEVEEYWKRVFQMRNAGDISLFPNLKKSPYFFLILPFSNVIVERIFSSVNKIKTCERNSLNTDTMLSILMTKEGSK
ncbi:hypothetical protein NQ314_014635 [Rhamnusium bicolor]|uniref:HAT C-terminal dimerisation domain-containing protein n=1 Tax=Rhamnusium bicolor TaxID=1586634 RepID=A0AAV8X0F9_9CUCU|nr:hypothetical protein NQ314_014635 [Rhamnusium bicolor]